MEIFAESNIGVSRKSNQDYCVYSRLSSNIAWCIVCDGMGGVNGGEVASMLAALAIDEEFHKGINLKKMKPQELKTLSIDAITKANLTVYEKGIEDTDLLGMGTTVVQVVVYNKMLYISHIGDSRAYLIRNNSIVQLTTDHSFVQNLVDSGEITSEEARVHPRRNIITRSLGVKFEVECDYSQINLQEGDIILLCTDGLSNYVTEDTMIEYINKYPKEKITSKLIDCAIALGGSDNITTGVIYL